MKPRDLAIVAAVVLLGGFAVADALRSSGENSTGLATQNVLARRDGPELQADIAWSPDGGDERIVWIVWPARASELYWLDD